MAASAESRLAARIGREIAARYGSVLRVVVAGDDGDAVTARPTEPDAVAYHREPVEALCALGADSELVVGSRGLHGLRAVGSVSERWPTGPPCSVLVVRDKPAQGRSLTP